MKVEIAAVWASAFWLLSAPLAAHAAGPAVQAPLLREGDTWVMDLSKQKGVTGFTRQRLVMTVDRVDADKVIIGLKPDGAPQAPQEHIVGLDWSLRLLINDEQKVTARPFVFPMKVGDAWTADWIDPRRQGVQVSAHFRRAYRVVGWEDVTVPAGKFHALKIESDGVADGQVIVPTVMQAGAVGEPGDAATASHVQVGGPRNIHLTTHSVTFYAPEVKHFVKEIEEQFNASDILVTRETNELVSFKPGL